ncbi:MAG: PPC domain-containing DNA-binding protein [Candidatus Eremiobacterota bacterium]
MKYLRESDGRILVSLTRGDVLRSTVETIALQEGIVSGKVSAIGALEDPEIGWWDHEKHLYNRRVFPGVWELLSMDGNLSLLDGKPFLHVHVAISGHDYAVKGGHFFDARVGVVVEMFLEPCSTPLPRAFCPALGLPRWEPGGQVSQ